MAERPTLPYYAPQEQLPAPLPSVAEILASTNYMVRYEAAPIVRVGEHYVVKYGKKVSLQEGENMLFVRQFSHIPVPTVYALFYDEETDKNFIVQEYIPGKLLHVLWDTLSYKEKKNISLQLRQHVDELRCIPSPGYYGGIWGQPALDYNFRGVEPQFTAAQRTEEFWAFGLWRGLGLKLKDWSEPRVARMLSPVWGFYQSFFRGHASVFTHGNLFPGTIMINNKTGAVVIIGWELSGWYPSFWEYTSAMLLSPYHHDWDWWIPVILDEFHAEFTCMWEHQRLTLQS